MKRDLFEEVRDLFFGDTEQMKYAFRSQKSIDREEARNRELYTLYNKDTENLSWSEYKKKYKNKNPMKKTEAIEKSLEKLKNEQTSYLEVQVDGLLDHGRDRMVQTMDLVFSDWNLTLELASMIKNDLDSKGMYTRVFENLSGFTERSIVLEIFHPEFSDQAFEEDVKNKNTSKSKVEKFKTIIGLGDRELLILESPMYISKKTEIILEERKRIHNEAKEKVRDLLKTCDEMGWLIDEVIDGVIGEIIEEKENEGRSED